MRPTIESPSGSSALTFRPTARRRSREGREGHTLRARSRRRVNCSGTASAAVSRRSGRRFASIRRPGVLLRALAVASTRDEVVRVPAEPIERKRAVRFAIVGCGAVTRLYAAPALARLSQRGLARVSRLFRPGSGCHRGSVLAPAVGRASCRPCDRARGGRRRPDRLAAQPAPRAGGRGAPAWTSRLLREADGADGRGRRRRSSRRRRTCLVSSRWA